MIFYKLYLYFPLILKLLENILETNRISSIFLSFSKQYCSSMYVDLRLYFIQDPIKIFIFDFLQIFVNTRTCTYVLDVPICTH